MGKILLIILIGVVIALILVAGVLIVTNPAAPSHAQVLDYGQEIQIDDFAFAALSADRAPQVGNVQARGIFYIIPFRVMNRAKVVPFRFKPDTTVLIDAAGGEYVPSSEARRAWFNANGQTDACAQEIGAGEDCVTTLVFDVPANTQAPLLKVSFAGGIFEIADALLYGNRAIQLK